MVYIVGRPETGILLFSQPQAADQETSDHHTSPPSSLFRGAEGPACLVS